MLFRSIIEKIERAGETPKAKDESVAREADVLLPRAVEMAIDAGQASVAMYQRHLKVGSQRAAKLIDQMEERGIIGPYEGAKPRKVLISKQQWYEMNALAQGGADKSYDENEEDTSEE